ncbi:thiamine pyrophosphate-dependent enzyme, partial [Stenotrophomonas sp. SrG]|uniref:thiamine pyrophosphate-dependent enzyme n=1 Tax=Stenotrophomonas sp. SrG TaxID=3414430 RepID=UPI003CF0B28E
SAVRAATLQARERALAAAGGTVLELMTYRLSAHTTAADARRSRDDAEGKAAWQREPMLRQRKDLIGAGVWSEEEDQAWT